MASGKSLALAVLAWRDITRLAELPELAWIKKLLAILGLEPHKRDTEAVFKK